MKYNAQNRKRIYLHFATAHSETFAARAVLLLPEHNTRRFVAGKFDA